MGFESREHEVAVEVWALVPRHAVAGAPRWHVALNVFGRGSNKVVGDLVRFQSVSSLTLSI